MEIAGFLCALFGLVLFFIPGVAPMLAFVGLILSILALCRKKELKNKGLSIAGVVIGAIAIVIGIVFSFIVLFTTAFITHEGTNNILNNVRIVSMASDITEIKSAINLTIAEEKAENETKDTKEIVKEKICLMEESNIVYDSISFENLPDNIKAEFKNKVAFSDLGKKYYKINPQTVMTYVELSDYVVDEDGNVYINFLVK